MLRCKVLYLTGQNVTKTRQMRSKFLMDNLEWVKHLFFVDRIFKIGRGKIKTDVWEGEGHQTIVLIEKICNFLDEDCRVSIKIIGIFGDGIASAHRNFNENLYKIVKSLSPSCSLTHWWQPGNCWACYLQSKSIWASGNLRQLDLLLWSSDFVADCLMEVSWLSRRKKARQSKTIGKFMVIPFRQKWHHLHP